MREINTEIAVGSQAKREHTSAVSMAPYQSKAGNKCKMLMVRVRIRVTSVVVGVRNYGYKHGYRTCS